MVSQGCASSNWWSGNLFDDAEKWSYFDSSSLHFGLFKCDFQEDLGLGCQTREGPGSSIPVVVSVFSLVSVVQWLV